MTKLDTWVMRAAGPVFVAWASWVSNSIEEVKISVTKIQAQMPVVGRNHAAESSKEGNVMKSYHVHYANKYPGGRVQSSETSVEVYDKEGQLRVKLEKNGAGQWADRSEEYGAADRHCLAPIPKNARFMKLHGDGKIGHSEEHSERKPIAEALYKRHGKVPSIKEIEKECCERGNWQGQPMKAEPSKSFEEEFTALKEKHGVA